MRWVVLGCVLCSVPAFADGRSVASIQKVVGAQMDALHACHVEAVKQAPALAGKFVYIDLGKLAEAEKELGLVEVDTLGKPTQYDYHFTLGNVLGGQGKLKPMFSALVEAISIAEDLGDMTLRPEQCWTKILAFTMKAKDWAYLKEVGEKARQVARVRGFKELETKATVALSAAKQHLGK